MKKFYYVILSMIAIALVSCTSELDEINNTVHQQETLSGNELGANLMKSFQNAVSRSSEIKHLSYPSYYGGAYLNKEGKLVVKVVNKTSEEIEKDLITRCGGNASTFKWPSQGISVTLTGIVKMTCNSQSGDSGCIVYTPDDMNIAGTLIGGVTNSNPSYFMPASRTVEKYGLELY